ncbi:DoxX family protein [Shewanella ulleungensis]|uniref:LysR family transcriptional regulator n=1 Tax=Shewanella ulleungensis TaxID=2282699 RepID=A0ABQ2QED1_9GAMM|nr:DoxX family protein [Shewanella ulleungensis]MCL1148844.1 DoxX family protein [Shewanella ulleungensis]GGP75261.1 LysR family transcriptional regulator [Shewanella ulleungensis]
MKLTPPYFLQRPDLGLLFLRVFGSLLVIYVHGLPKILHWGTELQVIDDPLHLGRSITLLCAIFAEVVCPIAITFGVYTRLACLPLIFLLLVSMLGVHSDWSIEQGQFGWLLLVLFGTIALCGPGHFAFNTNPKRRI